MDDIGVGDPPAGLGRPPNQCSRSRNLGLSGLRAAVDGHTPCAMSSNVSRLPRAPFLAAAVALSLLALSACDDPAKDVAKAEVGSAKPVPASSGAKPAASGAGATTAAVEAPKSPEKPAGAIDLSPPASKLEFVGSKVTASHPGSFEKWTGWIALDGDKIETAKGFIEIEMSSLKIEPAKLAGHLKTPDFFDVAKFPKATFTITGVKAGEKAGAYVVSGNLWLHGVERGISFPATIEAGKGAVQAKAEFAINRKDFGIVYAGQADDLIRDDVVIKLDLAGGAAK
jgi:polyisoprenoid-binding protein YceI